MLLYVLGIRPGKGGQCKIFCGTNTTSGIARIKI